MAEPRPWWASAGPVGGGIDPDEDPVEAHRAARRGRGPGAPADAAARSGSTDPDEPPATAAGVCEVCPVCSAARLLGDTRPELLAQLLEAGGHLAAAVRTLIEATSGSATHAPHRSTDPAATTPGAHDTDRD